MPLSAASSADLQALSSQHINSFKQFRAALAQRNKRPVKGQWDTFKGMQHKQQPVAASRAQALQTSAQVSERPKVQKQASKSKLATLLERKSREQKSQSAASECARLNKLRDQSVCDASDRCHWTYGKCLPKSESANVLDAEFNAGIVDIVFDASNSHLFYSNWEDELASTYEIRLMHLPGKQARIYYDNDGKPEYYFVKVPATRNTVDQLSFLTVLPDKRIVAQQMQTDKSGTMNWRLADALIAQLRKKKVHKCRQPALTRDLDACRRESGCVVVGNKCERALPSVPQKALPSASTSSSTTDAYAPSTTKWHALKRKMSPKRLFRRR